MIGKSQAQIGRELGVNNRKRIEMERDILKKAVGIFTKELL